MKSTTKCKHSLHCASVAPLIVWLGYEYVLTYGPSLLAHGESGTGSLYQWRACGSWYTPFVVTSSASKVNRASNQFEVSQGDNAYWLLRLFLHHNSWTQRVNQKELATYCKVGNGPLNYGYCSCVKSSTVICLSLSCYLTFVDTCIHLAWSWASLVI